MANYEPTKKQMIVIVKSNLNGIGQQIYDATIAKRVADRVNDEALSKRHIATLEKLEKMKDEYEQVLNEIELKKAD